jgi:proteic killer suppression protein
LTLLTYRVNIQAVIKSFGDRDTERLFAREPVRRYPAQLRRTMLRKLVAVDAAEALDDLRVPPGNRLEKLRGDRAGQHSIRVNDQWRVCFVWRDGDAHDVSIVDYH